MRGYVSLLVPAQVILVVVAATNAPPTDAKSDAISVTAQSHYAGDPHLIPNATTGPEVATGATQNQHSIPVLGKVTSNVTSSRAQHNDTDTPAEPRLSYNLDQDVFVVTCYSASKIQDIQYELIQDSKVVQNMTLHTNQPANFTIRTPGIFWLQCRARSPSGNEAISNATEVSLQLDVLLGLAVQRGVSEETDVSHDYRINRTAILTSLTQAVQDINILILCICGPAVLLILLGVLLVTYLRNRQERKVEMLI